jgi:acetyl esterase/lipase
MFGAQSATLLVAVLLHFISPTGALNAMAPGDGITQTGAIACGVGPRRVLDVYAPPRGATPAPVIVFFYGGGWETGAKEMYRFVGASMAAHGIIVVIPDYRLYPEVRFPAFMDDPAQAVAWTRSNVQRLGGDPHRLFLMGHSAGGQIATLLALDPRYLLAAGVSPAHDLCGVIGLAAPYDFLPPAPRSQRYWGRRLTGLAPSRSTMSRDRRLRCCCWRAVPTTPSIPQTPSG